MFLGVDVGGTKTEAVLADERGEVLARVLGGPANHESVGVDGAVAELAKVLRNIFEDSGASSKDIHFAFFGMAGIDHPPDYELGREMISRLGLERFDLENDGLVALRSGSWNGVGIAVSCGTGSVSFAFDGKRVNRIGGYSWSFGERLGSHYVAGLVVSAVVRAKDGRGRATKLVDYVEGSIGMEVEDLRRVSRFGLKEVSERVPTIISQFFKAMEDGDYVATSIALEIVDEVVKTVLAHEKRLSFEKPIDVFLTGSFFKNSPERLLRLISSALGDDFRVVVPRHNPVIGAVLLAMERGGLSVNEGLFNSLVRSYLERVKG